MSYLVLARKYRPQTFDDVAGQEHVTRTLRNAIKSGRLAHAYLFSGSRGIGKTSVARILAKAINCEKNTDGTPCNECGSCKAITAGTSVDVIEIDAASNRGIDSVRELREGVRYAPASSRYKIYIIDEVHMLTTEAFNALLKTLEEPPAHVIFLFATTEPHKVLPTILSRCQRFDFRRLTLAQTEEQLDRVLKAEKIGMEPEARQMVARLSEGGMRDALSLLDLVTASIGRDTLKEKITEQEVADLTGVAGRDVIEKTLEAIVQGNGAQILSSVEALYAYGYDVRNFYRDILASLRDALVIKNVGKGAAELLELPESSRQRLEEIFSGWDAVQIDHLFLIFQNGEGAVFHSSYQRYVLEALLLRMSQIGSLDSLGQLDERLARIEDALSGGGPVSSPGSRGGGATPSSGGVRRGPAPGAGRAAGASATGATGGVSLTGILGEVSSRGPMRWKMLLPNCDLIERDGSLALVPRDAQARQTMGLMSDEELTNLLRAIGETVGNQRGTEALTVRVDTNAAPASRVPAAAPAASAAPASRGGDKSQEMLDLKRQARENPVVGRVLDKFGVEDISIRDSRRR